MTKRAKIVLSSAAVLFFLFAVLMGGLVLTLQTSFGHEQIRRVIVTALNGRVNGSVYIGRIESGLLSGITIDSFAIRDPDDSLFLSTGRVTLRYDIRDILDRRIVIRTSRVEHPYLYLKDYGDNDWNFRRVFRSQSSAPGSGGRGIADYLILESTTIRDAKFALRLPWHPPAWARGAALDSILRYELSRDDIEIRREGKDFYRTYRWDSGNGVLVHARLSDPDSAAKLFEIKDFSVNETDPPFQFKNMRGTLRQLGDSIWLDIPRFDLPGSRGRAEGKIVWGSKLPIRYALNVVADSVSLKDIAWIHPSLPTTGGGKSKLEIRNNPNNLHLIDYVLTDLDVRSERSHLTGRMTFEMGADTLVVKDVQLAASPVNFDLLRRLNQAPFPYDWQGNIRGTFRASGGNLARFKVEESEFTFEDANVPNAIARGKAFGELNIFDPAFTEFKAFNVDLETFDLRTLQYLNKDFAQLQGTISGRAVLDSSWLDVRFKDAELFHHHDDYPVSRVTGNGRITWGEKYLTYDVDLMADSLSMTTMRHSYPSVALQGNFAGPIRVVGEAYDLRVSTTLSAASGKFTYDGTVDLDLPTYGAKGSGTFTNVDLQRAVVGSKLPRSIMGGRYAVDMSGDTITRLVGTASLDLDQSHIGQVRVRPSRAAVHVQGGLVYVDTFAVATGRSTLTARGSVSMVPQQRGSLAYALSSSSFQELSELFERPLPAPITGSATVKGTVVTAADTVDIDGSVEAKNIGYKTFRVGRAIGDFSLDNVLYNAAGFVNINADTVAGDRSVSPLLSNASASFQVAGPRNASFRIKTARENGIHAEGTGDIVLRDSAILLNLTSAEVVIDSINTYLLSAPARAEFTSKSLSVDSLILGRKNGGKIALRYLRVADDSLYGTLRTSPLDLAVLELLGSEVSTLGGTITASVDMYGTMQQPRVNGSVTVDNGILLFPSVGARLNRVSANIALEGDTIRIKQLTAETNKDQPGMLSVEGTVAFDRMDNPVFALQAVAKNFRAIDKRGLASLDISTTLPMTLTGPYTGATVRGGIHVDRGAIYIPEVIRKRVVDLNDPELFDVIDTTVEKNRSLLPSTPSEFVKNLKVENVGVNVGDDVWLRSSEANIKLGGSLTVTQGNGSGDSREALMLQGELRAIRGTYRLNIVPLVQPTFEVESGTLRFFGSSNVEPTLNITAINTVRKPQQSVTHQDIRIRATIGGTLSAPTLSLSSADNLPLTQSDLLSYLITGEPAFALDYTTRTYVNQLAAVVIRSAGNVLSSAIPRSVFDMVELQTPGAQDDAQARIDNPTLYNLLNTRAIFGKQLNNNLFLNLSTGLCAENFRNNLGFRLEYRLNRTYRLLFGLEPGSSELTCARPAGAARSVQQTPPQLGIDFFRTWRF